MSTHTSAPSIVGSSLISNELLGNAVRPARARYFFVSMAIVFIVLAILGFAPSYQLVYSAQMTLHWYAHVHGAIMASWLLLFLTQTILAARGNLNFHKQLGLVSVGVGAIMWLSLFVASIRPRLVDPPPVADVTWDIVLIDVYAITLFATFFIWGVLARRNPAVHKRLLVLATAVLLQAAVDRMVFLPGMSAAIYVRFIYLDLFLIVPLLIYDLVTTRRIHRITMIGTAIFIVAQCCVSMTWGSLTWHQFWFNRLAPFVEQVVEVELSDEQIAPLLGEYGDKKWRMRIFRDEGKIYLQLPTAPRFEIAPTSENEWFLRTMIWKVSFTRNPDGSVSKLVNRQPRVTWEVKRFRETEPPR
jgi:hypothetical protein